MKAKRSELPYNSKNMENAGIYRGSGLRGKTGKKKGGYTDNALSSKKVIGKPPSKMN